MVIQKFFETPVDQIPGSLSPTAAYSYKLLHGPDFSLVKYSTGHCFDFIKGIQLIISNFLNEDCPPPMKKLLSRANIIIEKQQFHIISQKDKADQLSIAEMLHLANFLRYHYKQNILELLEIYFQLDAWYGMADVGTTLLQAMVFESF